MFKADSPDFEQQSDPVSYLSFWKLLNISNHFAKSLDSRMESLTQVNPEVWEVCNLDFQKHGIRFKPLTSFDLEILKMFERLACLIAMEKKS